MVRMLTGTPRKALDRPASNTVNAAGGEAELSRIERSEIRGRRLPRI
jgi:hypothetical protein